MTSSNAVIGQMAIALVTAASFAASPVAAQEPGEESASDTIRLPAVEADVRRSLFDPGLARWTEGFAPSEALLPFADLSDWLDSRTGVGVRSYGGGGRQILSVRGARPVGVLVLLDGLPLNDPLTGTADLSTVPLRSLESATLVRGTGAARYGSGALGGALLLRTVTAGGRGAEPAAHAAVGSYGAYEFSGTADWTHGDLGLRVGGGLGEAENDFLYEDRLANGTPERRRENADSRSHWLSAAATVGDVRATVRYDELERGVPGRLGSTAFAGDRWREVRWSATATTSRAPGGATVYTGLRGLSTRYSPDGGDAAGQRAVDARLGGEVELAALSRVVVAGRLALEHMTGDDIAGAPDRWSGGLTAGRAFGDAEGYGFEPALGLDAYEGGAVLSPEIGAWAGFGAARVYARLGQGFRVPTFADLYFGAAPGIRANPDLDPERVILDAELGVELSRTVVGAEVSLRAAAWNRDTRDPIVWLASSAATWSPQNLDRLRAHGIDLEARVETRPGTRQVVWAFEGGLGLQRSRLGFGSNGNPLPYEPDVTVRGAAELRGAATTARLEATYTGSRTTSVAATRRLPGFYRVDARLRRRITIEPISIDVTLGVDNLLDRTYELVELFPEPGRSLRVALDIH